MSRNDVPMKYWMFTQNNTNEDDLPPNVWPDVEYVVWQHERGEQGTEHIQGYVVFVGKKRLQWLKNNCCARSHWEPRNGTHEQAKAYCQKEETRIAGVGHGPWTYGSDDSVATKKGERTDLKRVFDLLSSGSKEVDIMTNPDLFPVWARYYRAIERFELMSEQKRNWITFTTVYWGTSGCGKTRRAHYEASLKEDGTVGEAYYVFENPSGASTTAANPLRNMQYTSRFEVLDSVCVELEQPQVSFDGANLETAGSRSPFKLSWTGDLMTQFTGTGATISVVQDNSLHLIAYAGPDITAAPVISYNSRVRFVG